MANHEIIGAGQDTARPAPKKYQIIYADPPWELKKGSPNLHEKKQGQRELDYPTMKIKDITEIPVIDIADKNAVLFMWTTNKYIEQAYSISRAWGFNPSTMIVWAKKPKGRGLGGVFGISTEYLLYSRRGSLKNKSRMWSTWYEHKRLRHSEKPSFFRDMISECFDGEKIELFARKRFEGWDAWGNEIKESPVLGEESPAQDTMEICHTAPNTRSLKNAQQILDFCK